MKVHKVQQGTTPISFSHRENLLTLDATSPSDQADSLATFTIHYGGIPADGLIISQNRFGERTFFGDNWPNRARNWLPSVDHPSDKATVEFMVTSPERYEVIANGYKVEESDYPNGRVLTHWKTDVALPTKVMVIGAAALPPIHGYLFKAGFIPRIGRQASTITRPPARSRSFSKSILGTILLRK